MATRPVFLPNECPPYFLVQNIDFSWHPGQSVCQKQRNVQALHQAFQTTFPEKQVLEISTKSLQPEGVPLSAFNLLLDGIEVEKRYHASKLFQYGGPYSDMLLMPTSKAVKKDPRLVNSGRLLGYIHDGQLLPPDTTFYNWLYINALIQNSDLAAPLLSCFDAFTDIEYNPEIGLNCQARSAAIFVSLSKQHKLDQVQDPDQFRSLFYTPDHREEHNYE